MVKFVQVCEDLSNAETTVREVRALEAMDTDVTGQQ